jgi:WD40 repeat protein
VLTAPSDEPALSPAERQVDVWDRETGRFVRRSASDGPSVWRSAFSHDGGSLAVRGSIADSASGKVVSALDPGAWSAVAFSPDGRVLATTTDFAVKLWDVRNGYRAGATLARSERVNSIAFSPNGRQLAVGHTDDSARLWDTATGEPVGLLLQNRFDARLQTLENVAVAFSPDGFRVATASDQRYARVWDASSGAPVSPLLHHFYGVVRARFSPDSRQLVTASLYRTARIWRVAAGDGTPAAASLLADVAELVGGVRLGETGTMIALDRQDIQQRVRAITTMRSVIRELQPLLADLIALGRRLRVASELSTQNR